MTFLDDGSVLDTNAVYNPPVIHKYIFHLKACVKFFRILDTAGDSL